MNNPDSTYVDLYEYIAELESKLSQSVERESKLRDRISVFTDRHLTIVEKLLDLKQIEPKESE